jgi:hypothetical protein
MAVLLSLFLFRKPGEELDSEGESPDPEKIRALGDDLRDRLRAVADAVEKLTATGWSAETALYDILLSHEDIHTEEEAVLAVTALDLDPELFHIDEIDDWEGEDEEGWADAGEG